MAPEPEILKRKRSRPSDWWAVAPTVNVTVSPQHNQPLPKKRDFSSKLGAKETTAEESCPVNRGKIQRSGSQQNNKNDDDENAGGTTTPLRKGRSSNTPNATNKRKRGRPPQQGKRETAAKPLGERDLNSKIALPATGGEVALKKRGRPSASGLEDELADDAFADAGEDTEKRRRSRWPTIRGEEDELEIGPVIAAKKRGRPRSDLRADDLNEAGEGPSKNHDKKKRRRLPRSASPAEDEPPDPLRNHDKSTIEGEVIQTERSETTSATGNVLVNVIAEPIVRRRERTRNSDAKIGQSNDTVSTSQRLSRRKRRRDQGDFGTAEPVTGDSSAKDFHGYKGGQRSAIIEVETATSSFARNRNTANKVENASGITKNRSKKPSPAGNSSQNRLNGRRMSIANAKRKQVEVEDPAEVKRRRVEEESQEEDPSQVDSLPTYQHLAPVIRRVSRQKINISWDALGPAGVERISQLVYDVQRTVLAYFINEKRKQDGEIALRATSQRLIRKISRGMPFPPPIRNSRDDDLDFEKVLDHNRNLDAQLSEVQNANKSLESKLMEEEACLYSEEASLADLEKNAKSEQAIRKDAGRKLHSLLQSDAVAKEDAMYDNLGLENVSDGVLLFSHIEDSDLQDVAQELNGHLDSIQGNISRAGGISEGMRKSRAAVQASLFDLLESDEYEDIVLG